MSYGSAAGVASLARRYTNEGSFDASTNPTSATVTGWLSQISAMVNVALASAGFAIPVVDADILPALDGFVNALAADLAAAANSSGRFYSERALENGISPIKVISNDIRAWVEANTAGLAQMGASRTSSSTGQILYNDADVSPLFTRDGFGTWSLDR